MIGDILQPTHLLFVLVIALLVLGPKRLPEVGRALGRGLRDFRHALNTDDLRDQMISTTTTEGAPQPSQTPGEATGTQFPSEPPTAAAQTGSQRQPEPTPAEHPVAPSASDAEATAPAPPREPTASASAPDRTQ